MRLFVLVPIALIYPLATSGQIMVGEEFQVNSYTTSTQQDPVISHGSNGSFVTAWASLGQDGSNYAVKGQRYDSTGVPSGEEFQINSYTTSYQFFPSVSHGSDDAFVVVWTSASQDGSIRVIEGQRFDSTGAPAGAEFQINSYTTSAQGFPNVNHSNDGSFVVVWQSDSQDDSSYAIEGQRFDSTGVPIGGEFQVNSYTTNSQTFPSISHAAEGSFVVVWQSGGQDGSGRAVEGQLFDSTGDPVGGEFQINSFTTGYQVSPSVSHSNDGSFIVVWRSSDQDGSVNAVEGQLFDSTGDPLGGEFQINSYTTNSQAVPSISHAAEGSFVVVWQSSGQDGSSYGIEGQRFCARPCIVVFADGFESGDTAAWSDTVP